MDGEELKFDPVTKEWEVFESYIGVGLPWSTQMCQVNGVLYCCYESRHVIYLW